MELPGVCSTMSLVHCAAAEGNIFALSLLDGDSETLNCRSNRGFSPIHYAVVFNRVNTIKMLNKFGADLSIADPFGRSPAELAACEGLDESLMALADCNIDLLKITSFGSYLSHIAAYRDHVSILQVLASKPEIFGYRDRNGNSPAHAAVLANSVSSFSFLVQQGVDLNVRNYDGFTVVDLSEKKGVREEIFLLAHKNLKGIDKVIYFLRKIIIGKLA